MGDRFGCRWEDGLSTISADMFQVHDLRWKDVNRGNEAGPFGQ